MLVDDGATEFNWSVNIDMKILIKFITVLLLFFSVQVLAVSIDHYNPGKFHLLPDVAQASALFVRENEICLLQNGGGRLLCRTDLTDTDTTTISLGNQNYCNDIEGGWAFGSLDLYADEGTPARIYFMAHGGKKCSEAIRTITLNGMDETRGNYGIEGISELLDGRLVVVKEAAPVRVAVFTLVEGLNNYTPADLITVSNCSGLGDVTVKANGNLLIICKRQKKIQEYTSEGVLVGELLIPQFSQPEGIAEFANGDIGVLGEPNQYQIFTSGD